MPHARCCTPFILVPPFFQMASFPALPKVTGACKRRFYQSPVGWLGPPQSTGGYPFAFHGPSKRHPTTPQHRHHQPRVATCTTPHLTTPHHTSRVRPCRRPPVRLHVPRPPGALGWLGLICLPTPLSWPGLSVWVVPPSRYLPTPSHTI